MTKNRRECVSQDMLQRFADSFERGPYEARIRHLTREIDETMAKCGDEDSLVAVVMSDLAHCHDKCRECEIASVLHQRALAMAEKTMRSNSRGIIRIIRNIGYHHMVHGDYAKAAEYYAGILDVEGTSVARDHANAAAILEAVGSDYVRDGDDEMAEEHFIGALAAIEIELGPDHPDVATSLEHLALLYIGVGQRDRAAELAQCAFNIRAGRRAEKAV